ncbi:hypothetical protein [Caloramator proteoclasticus]|uniref:Sigma-70, region 4 n=1 Tax=Caloramator proteoclasticus DSM 10124 TaxID=1121262 RepID=A0A1M5BNM7_9CLOT|nr:hypothetical protein [Caloramator proteoclasticus]SHF44139.1 hypothetical protein SAMN02746091_02532 [Caloramator proteoclasticus DSM 10124]
MTVKEYLGRALKVDKFINLKLEQLALLNEFEDKIAYRSLDIDSIENIKEKIKDLRTAIESDIYKLFDVKKEVMTMIKEVNNIEYQTLLELRYLCLKSWEQIAYEMGYDLRYIYKLHKRALGKCKINLKHATKSH